MISRSVVGQLGLIFLMLLSSAGCGSKRQQPDMSVLYNRAAKHHDEYRRAVILIPGILGSRLVHETSGTVVWGAFAGTRAGAKPGT